MRWSYFIRKAYETDPLVCPKCSGELHIISFIDQRAVIIHSKRNSIAHSFHPGDPTLGKPKPGAASGPKRIDKIVKLGRTKLKRRLIASCKEISS